MSGFEACRGRKPPLFKASKPFETVEKLAGHAAIVGEGICVVADVQA